MQADITVDCYGMMCPMPIIKTAQAVKDASAGQVLEVISTDEGIKKDMLAWCSKTGNEFIACEENDGEFRAYIKKTGK